MRKNPRLEPLEILLGSWTTTGSHPELSGALHGRASFEWLEGGAFLVMRTEIDEPGIPTAVAVIGSDDSADGYSMQYFDERGVSRLYQMSLRDGVWEWWRDAPAFNQRFRATIEEGGAVMVGRGTLSRDGSNWKPDLDLTFRRA